MRMTTCKRWLCGLLTVILFWNSFGVVSHAEEFPAEWPTPPEIGAYAAVLMDATTGTILYTKNPDEKLYPASITKVLTALVALENTNLNDMITYSYKATHLEPGSSSVAITEEEEVSVEDSLYAMIMASANEAANGLAEHVAGTTEDFANMMNEKAAKLGCKNSHFVNPHGYHNPDHYTTARDMAIIMNECVKNPAFLTIASTRKHTIQPTNKQPEPRYLATKVRSMKAGPEYYEYVVAGKTGYHKQAANTLVTYAEKDNMKLVCAVMYCSGTLYQDTNTLFEYGFNNFNMYQVKDNDTRYALNNNEFFTGEEVSIEFDDNSWVILPAGTNFEDTDATLTYIQDENNNTSSFANVTYKYKGMEVGSGSLKLVSHTDEEFDFEAHRERPEEEPERKEIHINIWYVVGSIFLVVLIAVAVIYGRSYLRYLKRKRRRSVKIKFKSQKRLDFKE